MLDAAALFAREPDDGFPLRRRVGQRRQERGVAQLLAFDAAKRMESGCLAVAVLWNGSMVADYGWGIARSKRKAYLNALDDCGPDCKKRAYTCTKW